MQKCSNLYDVIPRQWRVADKLRWRNLSNPPSSLEAWTWPVTLRRSSECYILSEGTYNLRFHDDLICTIYARQTWQQQWHCLYSRDLGYPTLKSSSWNTDHGPSTSLFRLWLGTLSRISKIHTSVIIIYYSRIAKIQTRAPVSQSKPIGSKGRMLTMVTNTKTQWPNLSQLGMRVERPIKRLSAVYQR